jgi:Holliday junction resolvase RusA-like endonuclease
MNNNINTKNFKPVKYENNVFHVDIKPFEYLNGNNPRLPRKNSKHYDLKSDLKTFFSSVFLNIDTKANKAKYSVSITVFNGIDRLGGADLDNYCKALLDGITFTKKVWIDDKQVDEIVLKRKYLNNGSSKISLKIKPI